MRIVFFGTPLFSAVVLEHLFKSGLNIVAVVSKPDKPAGRARKLQPTAVKTMAQNLSTNLPVYQPPIVSTPEFETILKKYEADLFVVVAYGEIIKSFLLQVPKIACINLHTSLLPKYRGAAPIQRAIMGGESETGVTIMHMAKKMDAGDLIRQVKVPIACNATFGEIEQALCSAGKEVLLEVINAFAEHQSLPRCEQEHALATIAPKIELEECEINWQLPAAQIHDLVRGVNPIPGAWCYITVDGVKKRLKINKTCLTSIETALAPAAIINLNEHKANLVISTGAGSLELIEVQLEGRKATSSAEFARGVSRNTLSFIWHKSCDSLT